MIMREAMPAFVGPAALAPVSAHFASVHPAFAAARAASPEERRLELSPLWAQQLRGTFLRLTKPPRTPTQARHDRRKKQRAHRRRRGATPRVETAEADDATTNPIK